MHIYAIIHKLLHVVYTFLPEIIDCLFFVLILNFAFLYMYIKKILTQVAEYVDQVKKKNGKGHVPRN